MKVSVPDLGTVTGSPAIILQLMQEAQFYVPTEGEEADDVLRELADAQRITIIEE